MPGEVKLIRELMEKDVAYIKEKLTNIEQQLDSLTDQTVQNTEFRIKFKTLSAVIGTIATFMGGILVIIVQKLWK